MPARCFLALELPDTAVATLQAARGAFLAGDPAWAGEKWVDPTLLHITVAFLGRIDDVTLDATVERLRESVAAVPAFELRLSGVAAVPSARRAAMLWATLDDPRGELTALRDALLTAFPDVRADRDRPMRPHVTLARARSHRSVEASALAAASLLVTASGKTPDGIVSVRSVTLFSSTLRPAGPEYRKIARVHLAR